MEEPAVRVYPQRWLILFLFSALSCLQGGAWSIPGGIAKSMQNLYPGLSDDDLQLLLNYGPIFFLASVLFYAAFLDRQKGLRHCLLIAYLVVVLGCVTRLLATDPESTTSRRLLSASFILNAIAGPISMGAPSKLAENWFPAHERGFATSVSAAANLLGCIIGFAVAPAMVPPSSTMADLTRFNVMMLALTGGCFLATIIYFPSHPPSPPSKSAVHSSQTAAAFSLGVLLRDVGRLCKNKDFIVVTAAYAVCNGLASGWSGALDMNVDRVGIGETTAGWLVFGGTLAGAVTAVILGKLIDRYRCHRWALIACVVLTGVFATWFSLVTAKTITFSSTTMTLVQVAIATTGASAFYNGLVPVAFELAIEASYTTGAGEGVVLLLMTSLNSLATLILLFVPLQSAANAFNWVFVGGSFLVALTTWLFLGNPSARFKEDTTTTTTTTSTMAESSSTDDEKPHTVGEAMLLPSSSDATTAPLLLSIQQ
jgi:MFS transporter, FLVCR family, disrupted in renal carcinoma protein 2